MQHLRDMSIAKVQGRLYMLSSVAQGACALWPTGMARRQCTGHVGRRMPIVRSDSSRTVAAPAYPALGIGWEDQKRSAIQMVIQAFHDASRLPRWLPNAIFEVFSDSFVPLPSANRPQSAINSGLAWRRFQAETSHAPPPHRLSRSIPR